MKYLPSLSWVFWIVTLCALLAAAGSASGQTYFAGAGPGFAILTGGATSSIAAQSSEFSQYKPSTGLLAHGFAGWHFHEYVSVQGIASWNRNNLTYSGARTGPGVDWAYEQLRRSSQFNAGADAMLYFRDRASWVRPYLSIGLGVMRLKSEAIELRVARGNAPIPEARFTVTKPGVRVAAGIDAMLGRGWGFRYAFLEATQANPFGARLSPRGKGTLMNFQNTFGLVKYWGSSR